MRIVRFRDDGKRVGVMIGNEVLDLQLASGDSLPSAPLELIAETGAKDELSEILQLANVASSKLPDGSVKSLEEVELTFPFQRPGKIVCLGRNYRDHAAESGADVPDEPVVFAKATSSVIGPKAPIQLPRVAEKVDYEVELAVVVGRTARHISAENALDHVAGYSVLCDVSARDYQHEKPGGQWYLGKSFDTFCPIGPALVTADEIPDPHNLDIRCTINGQCRQRANTGEMVFDIPTILSYLSEVFTLEPGDVVSTGTPSGVGAGQDPPTYLESGDCVRCAIEQVGELVNPVE